MRGVVWSPASRTTDTFPGDPNNATIRRPEFCRWYARDIPLMKGMNVNTVRMQIDPGLDGEAGTCGDAVLDSLYEHGINAIIVADGGVNDLTRVRNVVNRYKSHPAVLMFSLGNEWNLNCYYRCNDVNRTVSMITQAVSDTERAAALIQNIDSNHPVATNYWDIDVIDPGDVVTPNGLYLADTARYVSKIPSVVVWELNVYRGNNFGTLF